MRDAFLLLRPQEWMKNLLVFFPLFFALQIFNFPVLAKAGWAFFIFCALASGIYIFNDSFDVDADRVHPRKKMRALPAGRISMKKALSICAALLAAGLTGAWFISYGMFFCSLIYIGLNVAYTIKLKHVPIIDIVLIALGFVLRIIAGGIATEIRLSPWIIIMTFLLSLFLALGKRRDDVVMLLQNGEGVRKSVNGYKLAFVDKCLKGMAVIVVVSYLIFTMSSATITKFGTDHLYLTTIFVIPGIIRYMHLIIAEQQPGDPSDILMQDHIIQISVTGWIVMFGLLVYF